MDFSHYEPKAIRRRISRRMTVQRLTGLDAYASYLRDNEEEVDKLYEDLFMPPTGFFRDQETFSALKKQVFPKIVKRHASDQPLRVWLPGCATGEEAYSIAITFQEFVQSRSVNIPIQIFATDSNR